MSWNDPDILKEIAALEADEPPPTEGALYAAALSEAEQNARSGDLGIATEGRLMLAALPALEALRQKVDAKSDPAEAAKIVVALADAVAMILTGLVAHAPHRAAPAICERIERTIHRIAQASRATRGERGAAAVPAADDRAGGGEPQTPPDTPPGTPPDTPPDTAS